jgi:hypothetical protein
MENENNHNKNHIFFKSEVRCQEKPRMQDFSPFTPEVLGDLCGPRPPAIRAARFARCMGCFETQFQLLF